MEKENILSQFSILKNQINPHFLFNSMNILAAIIPSNPDQAVAFTTQFAKLYRKVLELRDQLIIPLQQELEFVDSFLFLQKMRFDDNLIVNYNIEEKHQQSCLPPFALQLLVENAIKHNIVSEDQPLSIDIFTESDMLFFGSRTGNSGACFMGLSWLACNGSFLNFWPSASRRSSHNYKSADTTAFGALVFACGSRM